MWHATLNNLITSCFCTTEILGLRILLPVSFIANVFPTGIFSSQVREPCLNESHPLLLLCNCCNSEAKKAAQPKQHLEKCTFLFLSTVKIGLCFDLLSWRFRPYYSALEWCSLFYSGLTVCITIYFVMFDLHGETQFPWRCRGSAVKGLFVCRIVSSLIPRLGLGSNVRYVGFDEQTVLETVHLWARSLKMFYLNNTVKPAWQPIQAWWECEIRTQKMKF